MLNSNVRHAATEQAPMGDVFDRLPVAACVFDASRNCVRANAAARLLLAASEPAGLGLSVLFADWTSPPTLQATDASDRPSTIAHGDGRLFAVHAAPLGNGDHCLVLTDVTAHRALAAEASHDPLTGLLQRSALLIRLEAALATAAAQGKCDFAVHYIDLDRFKTVNETLGYATGDGLLVKVAERLRKIAAPRDMLARLGGDEFAIVQVDGSGEAAQALSKRLTDLLARTYVIGGQTLNIGVSIGMSLAPSDGENAATLLRHADMAMSRVKAEGRGGVRFFEPAMDARMQARRLLETDLRRALALRQFSLNFQPLVGLASGETSGFEALLRWHHPERGPVSPADFIPLAEELGLIVPIGEWVLRTACREAAGWPIPASVAVNISPVQFKTGKLTATVAAVLAQSGLPPERLELEITEGALLDETTLAVTTLNSIRALGVKISMDDFGTGYSSLSYLRKFPFDKIKIDQSFVRGLGGDTDCEAIVRAVATLGASLGMRTTAEGVETAEQMERIRAEGCTEVQGYFTGRPMPAADVVAFLAEQIARRD